MIKILANTFRPLVLAAVLAFGVMPMTAALACPYAVCANNWTAIKAKVLAANPDTAKTFKYFVNMKDAKRDDRQSRDDLQQYLGKNAAILTMNDLGLSQDRAFFVTFRTVLNPAELTFVLTDSDLVKSAIRQ